LGGIIRTIGIFIVGIAAGYTWRDRISLERRARERDRRERRIREINIVAAVNAFHRIEGRS
jgi:hypothetical protein